MTDDVTVYPADEEEQHDLYSAKCKCKPTVEVIGATLVYSHNRLWELIDVNPEWILDNRNNQR